jgi:hypothetical protein
MNLTPYQEWEEDIKSYISATKLFNYFLDDPLLDYLDKFGSQLGLEPSEIPEEIRYILDKGILFEKKVIELIEKVIPVATIPIKENWIDGCSRTLQAMKEGHPIIYQGYLVNHNNKTKGIPDLLVRSDYLNKFKPGLISDQDLTIGSPFGPWHYRVIDIKMSNINLTVDGKYIINSKLYKTYKAQVLVYNLALGCLQGYQPLQAYLLGRGSHNYDNSLMNMDCFSSIATVDYRDYDQDFLIKLNKALEWHQTLNIMNLPDQTENGHYNWNSLDQQINNLELTLKPNMKNKYDYRWNSFKNKIAIENQELTLLWNCGPAKRQEALNLGCNDWASYLKFCEGNPGQQNTTLSNIIYTNLHNKIIRPNHLENEYLQFIPKLNNPFIVLDFEISSNLNDEFDQLPYIGGIEITFLIGASIVIPLPDGPQYRYFPFLIDQMTPQSEYNMLRKFINWIIDIQSSMGPITFYHWSKAEPIFFEKMIERQWDNLTEDDKNLLAAIQFSDLLTIFRYQPITIKGSLNFGLKEIGKAMYKHGMIQSTWANNDINGLAAMLRIFKYNLEAVKLNTTLSYFKEVGDIVEYNMIDCQVLAEIILFLQKKYLLNLSKDDQFSF